MVRLSVPLLGVAALALLAGVAFTRTPGAGDVAGSDGNLALAAPFDAGPSPCELAPAKCQTGDSLGAAAGVLSEPQVLHLAGASRPAIAPGLLVLEQPPPFLVTPPPRSI